MKLNYQLTNSDFLEYQLYTSTKSKLNNKKRFRSRVIIPIIYIGFALVNYWTTKNLTLAIILVVIAILWLLLYPLYSKWANKRHLQKHIEENYKNRINIPAEIHFDENSMFIKDHASESRIDGSELKELIEIKNHFFLKLTTETSLIVPKKAVENQKEFKTKITGLGADYVNELDWKW